MPSPEVFPILPTIALQELGDRIAIARRARGFTQRDLAHLSSVSVSSITALEKGSPGVALGTLAKALDAMDLLDELSQLLVAHRDPAVTRYAITKLGKGRK